VALKDRKPGRSAAPAEEEVFDATRERLKRAEEMGQKTQKDVFRPRRILDPFDVMRATRQLAPHNPKLNDIRWLIGDALRRLHRTGGLGELRAAPFDGRPITKSAFGHGLTVSDVAFDARGKVRAVEEKVGPAAWPIVARIVIEGAGVRDCRDFVRELATPWRADAVVSDRLRVALDAMGGLVGVTAKKV
jgi:hypothetical protein